MPTDWKNKFRLRGKSQRWIYTGGCNYPCSFHRGKVEWHHPIAEHPEIGIYLCEAHHSLLQGRNKRYLGELIIMKTLREMRSEIYRMVITTIRKTGYSESDIDKH